MSIYTYIYIYTYVYSYRYIYIYTVSNRQSCSITLHQLTSLHHPTNPEPHLHMISRAGPEMTGRVATEDPARFELVIHGIPGGSRWVFGYVLGNDDMELDED